MKKILPLGVIALALLMLLFVARQSNHQSATEQQTNKTTKTAKIGVVLPLTGDAATYGEPAKKVMELAAKEINEKIESGGTMIDLIFEDGQCDGKTAISAFKKLIDTQKIAVAIGGICSSETLAILPIAEANNVAVFSPTASSPDLTGKSRLFSRNIPSDQSQGNELAKYIKTQKWNSVAVISEKTPFALGTTSALEQALKGSGIKLAKEEFSSDIYTFQTQLNKLKQTTPDALFISTQAGPATERILTQLQELAWNPKLLLVDNSLSDESLLENFPNLLEGSIGALVVGGENPIAENLRHSYQQTYQENLPFENYSQLEYDAIFLLHAAVTNAGYDGVKVANWLRTQVKNWSGASGLTNIEPDGDRLEGRAVYVVSNGKPVKLSD